MAETRNERKRRLNREAQRRWWMRQHAETPTKAYRLFLDEYAVANFLIDSGRLSPDATLDRSKLERALEQIISDHLRKA